MRARVTVSALLLVLVASPVLASFGGGGGSGGSEPPSSPAPAPATTNVANAGPREQAERLYAEAYEEVGRAKKDLADGKSKNAEKHFRKALDWGGQATSFDATYHEAWNLVGFCARKLGDYDQAFAAYGKCLAIKPDYAPAREYLGEAWLEKGDALKAREQLVLLEQYRAVDDAKTLRTAIEAYDTAHPESAKTDSTTTQ